MREHLDERQRRTFAAAEAKVLGRGGISQVVAATGSIPFRVEHDSLI